MVARSPGRQHFSMVVVECTQLGQPSEETGEMLRLVRMVEDANPPQHIQHGVLQPLDCPLILNVGPLCEEDVTGSCRTEAPS